ncbi:MAG: glycosyltransferase [Bryobacteraceae bacterium]|nr:glycosyltransferase [Bryobacteraceae bacterium]
MAEPSQPIPVRVSAILISRNQESAARRAIQALEASPARAQLQILLVDSGSSDGSGRLDEEFPNVTALRLQKNFGVTRACNIAMRTASGEFILFLDPGVELAPDAVPRMVERLDEDAEATAVCPLILDTAGNLAIRTQGLPSFAELAAEYKTGITPPAMPVQDVAFLTVEAPGWLALMVRRQFLQGMNWLDARFGSYGAELDLFAQIKRANKKIRLLPAAKGVLHREEKEENARDRVLRAADRATGILAYAGKHNGGSIGPRISLSLWALGRALGSLARPKELGFEFQRFLGILTGQRIDGTQE